MPTIHDLIAQAEDTLRTTKRAAIFAREDLQADPKSRRLHIAADDAEHVAREAGRKVALYKFDDSGGAVMGAGRPGEPDSAATPEEKRDAELAALHVAPVNR